MYQPEIPALDHRKVTGTTPHTATIRRSHLCQPLSQALQQATGNIAGPVLLYMLVKEKERKDRRPLVSQGKQGSIHRSMVCGKKYEIIWRSIPRKNLWRPLHLSPQDQPKIRLDNNLQTTQTPHPMQYAWTLLPIR